jgi:hypothetical protein
MSDYHTKQKEETKVAVAKLMDALNVMGTKKDIVEGMIEELQCTHRTVQQNFCRVMLDVMKKYAEFRHDLRNEASVEVCKFITEQLIKEENQSKTYLPFV